MYFQKLLHPLLANCEFRYKLYPADPQYPHPLPSAPPASLSKIFYWMTYVNGPAFYLSICLIILLISHFLQHVWETMNSQSQFLPQSSSHIFHFSYRTAHSIPLQDCKGLNWPFMLKSLEGVNVWLMEVFLWGLL